MTPSWYFSRPDYCCFNTFKRFHGPDYHPCTFPAGHVVAGGFVVYCMGETVSELLGMNKWKGIRRRREFGTTMKWGGKGSGMLVPEEIR